MSIQALKWAFDQHGLFSADKFVLVTLANYASDDGRVWPCTLTITTQTEQNRKTVLAALVRLQQGGWISDTGQRIGRTKQVKVFQLQFDRKASQNRDALNGPKNGMGNGPKIPTNGPKNGMGNGPKNGTRNPLMEPSLIPEREPARAPEELASWTDCYLILGRISESQFPSEHLRSNQWPQKWTWLVTEAMPLRLADLELIERFYLLPSTHGIFDVTRKRHTFVALLENLRSEPQKIQSALRAIGRKNLVERKVQVAIDDTTPASWVWAIRKVFGPDAQIFARKSDFAPSVRARIEEVAKEFEHAGKAA